MKMAAKNWTAAHLKQDLQAVQARCQDVLQFNERSGGKMPKAVRNKVDRAVQHVQRAMEAVHAWIHDLNIKGGIDTDILKPTGKRRR